MWNAGLMLKENLCDSVCVAVIFTPVAEESSSDRPESDLKC